MVVTIDGVVASAFVIVRVEETGRLTKAERGRLFSKGELAYAMRKRDPERRLAARLAAKRGAQGRLAGAAAARLTTLGADSALVSLTHEGPLAAASVLLLEAPK